MSDALKSQILDLLRGAGPKVSMSVQAIAAELEVDDHRIAGALYALEQDGKLKRTSTRPTAYAIRAAAMRESA